VKLKTGVAKSRDLPFRRENNLRILNGVLDIVLFQNSVREDTTAETQYPEVGDPPGITWVSREAVQKERRGSKTEALDPTPRYFFSKSGRNASYSSSFIRSIGMKRKAAELTA